MDADFKQLFETLTGHPPFPWQQAMYKRFVGGNLPDVAAIPTGLGKTSVIAIWLIALAKAEGAPLPRRLAYVVNRRTVVDQATDEAINLRNNATNIGIHDVAISTLRGQFADNREWSTDPSRPAVICGTVDMIGSRLLFSGYRIGFKSRPLEAGFLGQDTLLVHDEAHLEPAFQSLITSITHEQERESERGGSDVPWPKLRVMQLTATTRSGNGQANESTLTLERSDRDHPVVKQRIEAVKQLHLHSTDDSKDAVVDEIVARAGVHKDSNAAVLVYVRSPEDVEKVCDRLHKKEGVPEDHIQFLTGTMRGLERDMLAAGDSVFMRFLPESNRDAKVTPAEGTVYLICTSAGEVGVDISADHMVCDLSTLDSMIQRFGRVNRFGKRADTQIDVVCPAKLDEKHALTPARQATRQLLEQLNDDASPQVVTDLLRSLTNEQRAAAFAPAPTIPPATDILFDAWAMTSIRGIMPGRPPVEPYLRGIADWQPPQTTVAWREEVYRITDSLLETYPPQDLLNDYPLKPHELLRDRSDRVFRALQTLAKRHPDQTAWILDERGGVETPKLGELGDKQRRDWINNCTVLLPPSIGGLSHGMLDGKSEHADDVADQWTDDGDQSRRRRSFSSEREPDEADGLALIRTMDTDPDADEHDAYEADHDGEQNPKRFWHWFALPRDAEDATRASVEPISWKSHTQDVVQLTQSILDALNWPDDAEDLKQAVILAAHWHDLGKKREQWQRSIGNPNPSDGNWYAKPGKPADGPRWRPQRLSDYRHEFGSVLDVLNGEGAYDAKLNSLSPEMQDVVLHLVAAHHGRARPHFTAEEMCDPEYAQTQTAPLGSDVPRRFARLQRKYGRWGLAYLESLLRAADWAASAEPSAHATQAQEATA